MYHGKLRLSSGLGKTFQMASEGLSWDLIIWWELVLGGGTAVNTKQNYLAFHVFFDGSQPTSTCVALIFIWRPLSGE